MNTTHDFHRLSACGFKGLDRIARERRHQRNMERLGFWLTVFFLVLGVIASWPAGAEPTNAPDVRGHFVLVVGGSIKSPMNAEFWNRIQPFTVTGFTSFYKCRGAGEELQARFNSDGYVLDFVCVATSR